MRQARRGGRAMEQRCRRCRRCAWGVKLGWADQPLSHLSAPLLAATAIHNLRSYPPRSNPALHGGWQRRPPRKTHACRSRALIRGLCHCEQRHREFAERSHQTSARLPLLRVRGRQSLLSDGASDARLPGLNPPLHILQSITPRRATDGSPLRFSERL